MAIIPRKTDDNYSGTLPQALTVPTANPQISGVQPVQPVNYTPAINNLIDLTERYTREAENTAALKVDNDLTKKRIEISGNFGKEKGEKAFNYQPSLDEFNKYAEESTKNLAPNVQKKIAPVIGSHTASLFSILQGHSNIEIAQWTDEQELSSIDLNYKTALAGSDNPDDIRDSMAKAISVMQDRANRFGWSKEKAGSEMQKTTDSFHVGIVEKRLIEKKDLSAQSYYNDNKDWISGEARALLEAKLKSGTIEGEGRRIANQVISEFPNYDKLHDMEKKAIELSNGNEDVAKNAIEKIKGLYNSYYLQKSTQNKINNDLVYGDMANGKIKTVEELTAHPAFLSLEGIEQEQAKNYVSAFSMANENKEIRETSITEAFNIYKEYPDNIAKQNEAAEQFIGIPVKYKAINIELNSYNNDKKQVDTDKQEKAYDEAERILKENGEKYGYSKDLYMLVPEKYTQHLKSANLNRLKQAQYIFNYRERDNQANTLETYLEPENFKKLLTGEVSISRLLGSKSLSTEGKNILTSLLKEYDSKKVSALQGALKIINPKTIAEYMPNATETERSVKQAELREQVYNETLQAIATNDEKHDPINRAKELLEPIEEGMVKKIIKSFAFQLFVPEANLLPYRKDTKGDIKNNQSLFSEDRQKREKAINELHRAGYVADEDQIQWYLEKVK